MCYNETHTQSKQHQREVQPISVSAPWPHLLLTTPPGASDCFLFGSQSTGTSRDEGRPNIDTNLTKQNYIWKGIYVSFWTKTFSIYKFLFFEADAFGVPCKAQCKCQPRGRALCSPSRQKRLLLHPDPHHRVLIPLVATHFLHSSSIESWSFTWVAPTLEPWAPWWPVPCVCVLVLIFHSAPGATLSSPTDASHGHSFSAFSSCI